MIGRSAVMRRAFEMADRVAATDSTVLILGESGTGKDCWRRKVHARSPRNGKAFVAVNCAALPETLIESEFIWLRARCVYRRGAAEKRKVRVGLWRTISWMKLAT